MDTFKGATKCCFRANIGAITYYIAGIRLELE